MSYKLIKASLPVMTLGALSQVAQADTLDDAIKDAKDAGFSTSVQTRTEKVSSQSEADRLNQEEANRVQALAQRIQTQIQKTETSDQSVRQVVTSVLTAQAKESTEIAGQNQMIVQENKDAQKAYEEAVRAIEAKNAKAQADYEAQKAKVAEENAQAQKAYEAQKAKVEADNAANKKGYEEAIKRIAAENKQAQDAYQTARQKAESEIHTKEWSDTKVIEEAKAAGVAIRPTKIVDKGTVKESDLATIQSEYDKAVADVRAKLEIAKKEAAKGAIELKADNELKQFVKAQQDAIKAIINADNANTATTHIHTVVRRGTVMANPDRLKQAYQDLLQTVKDNAVRNFNAQQAYYQSQGKTEDEAIALTRKAVAPHFLTRIDGLNPEFKQALLAGKPKITEVPVTGTLPLVPIGTDLTNTTDPTVVAYKKAISDIEAKLYEVWRSNEAVSQLMNDDPDQQVTFSDNYEADLKAYQESQKYLNGVSPTTFMVRQNGMVQDQAQAYIQATMDHVFHGSSQLTTHTNENNMNITKSSDSVQFLAKPKDDGDSMFDIHSSKTTDTPEFFQPSDNLSGGVDTTLVRIPKGESITVRYTLKNGQPYISGKQTYDGISIAQFFAQDTVAQYQKENKELHDEDIQDVHTIEMKITNNGGVNDGDIIVAVRNHTGVPFYVGVANGTGHDNRIQWKLNPNEPSLAFNYKQDVSFRNQKDQLLAFGLPQGEVTQEPNYYHGVKMGTTTHMRFDSHYISKLFVPLSKADAIEKVDTTEIPINPDGSTFSKLKWDGYRPIFDSLGTQIFTPPTGWKDKYMWTSIKYGMSDETTFSAVHKTYNKPLVDWGARNDRHNAASLHESGSFMDSFPLNGHLDINMTLKPRPIEPPKDVKVPKLTVDLVREVALPTASANDPVDPATVVSIEPVKWIAKYTKPFTEEPPKPKENPVQPPIIPEPKKPEDKPLPTPPKKEDLPKGPELKAIASGSNSFVVKSRKATRPSINVERIQYVAEGRVSSANSLVVRTKNEVKRAGSGNSFIIRRM